MGQLNGAHRDPFGHDADDCEPFAIDRDALTDDRRVGSKPLLPEAMAQDDFRRDDAQITCRGERAAQGDRSAKNREEIRCDAIDKNLEGFTAISQNAAHVVPAGKVLEGSSVEAPVVQVAFGDARMRTRPDHCEPLRLREVQRAQQHRIDCGENCGASTDSQRERKNRRQREPPCLSQSAECVAQLLIKTIHAKLLCCVKITEPAPVPRKPDYY